MEDKLERLIRMVYKDWKSNFPQQDWHPDEEELACFFEGRLSEEENNRLKLHFINCQSCSEVIAMQLKLKETQEEVPAELLKRAKNLVREIDKAVSLEIFLRLRENILELVNTTGDVLLGRELVPAPILRSRKIKDFKNEVTILKDFKDIRVEIKVENKAGKSFNLTVIAKEKATLRVIKDLRITLLEGDLELESYLVDSGKVVFEHVVLGKYTVELSSIDAKLASVVLEIKI